MWQRSRIRNTWGEEGDQQEVERRENMREGKWGQTGARNNDVHKQKGHDGTN